MAAKSCSGIRAHSADLVSLEFDDRQKALHWHAKLGQLSGLDVNGWLRRGGRERVRPEVLQIVGATGERAAASASTLVSFKDRRRVVDDGGDEDRSCTDRDVHAFI